MSLKVCRVNGESGVSLVSIPMTFVLVTLCIQHPLGFVRSRSTQETYEPVAKTYPHTLFYGMEKQKARWSTTTD